MLSWLGSMPNSQVGADSAALGYSAGLGAGLPPGAGLTLNRHAWPE